MRSTPANPLLGSWHLQFDADGRLRLSAMDTVPGSDVARHHRLIWEWR
jgi:hypothetical protein